jgi:hypothetical protein
MNTPTEIAGCFGTVQEDRPRCVFDKSTKYAHALATERYFLNKIRFWCDVWSFCL